MSRKRIYIAGKMTGVKEYNYPKFFGVDHDLRHKGYNVVNPARVARDMFGWSFAEFTKNFDLERLIKIELEHLATCDSIYLLKGWETSLGAKKELQVALALGLEVICE